MTHVLMSTCVVTTPVMRLNDYSVTSVIPEVTMHSSEKLPPSEDGADRKGAAADFSDADIATATTTEVSPDLKDEPKDKQQTPRKKQHRRGRKSRKWRPYSKLSWDERRALEDREARRAQRIRDERLAHGQPVAPYNTTQFLMEDHNVQEPDLDGNHHHHHHHHRDHESERRRRPQGDSSDTAATAATVGDSDEYYYSSPDDEDEFLQKEFCEVYDSINAERLASMSKLQLIQEYMQLEERVDKLENRVPRDGSATFGDGCHSDTSEKVRIFQQEIRKLAEENERLRQENAALTAAKLAREEAAAAADVVTAVATTTATTQSKTGDEDVQESSSLS